jgi:hypothetical protein
MLLVVVAIAVMVGQPWQGLLAGPLFSRAVAGLLLLFAGLILLQNIVVRAAGDELRLDAMILPVTTGFVYVAFAAFGGTSYGTGAAVLLTAHLLSSAAVLGTSMIAMSTGHWYLANAKLSFDILIRLCRFFVAAIAVKAGVVAIYAVSRWEDYARLEDFYKIVMGTRVAAGVGFALALALMSLSCAKRRANQSATGILYVAVVFVLIGETISIYLTLGTQRPI